MCSILDNTCMPAFTFPTIYEGLYDCQMDGYNKAVTKIDEIGIETVNKYGIYSTFYCKPVDLI